MYLDKAKAMFKELNIAPSSDVLPCTEEEVEELEQKLGFPLPEAYREFLLWMGFDAGRFLRGSDAFYSRLEHLQEAAVDLLKENNFPESLPDDAFVFFMHQGYQFAFLRVSEGDDPPVYYYNEGETKENFIRSHPSFSDLLMAEIESYARMDSDN